MSDLPSVIRSLRHRDYRLFVAGQLISLVGTWMQLVAQAWLVYRLTGSAALLGLIGFASQIPVLLLGPAGGAAADRLDRRRVIIATQSASTILAVTIAALTLSGHIQLWHVFVLAGLLGVVNAFDVPARHSFIVEMVGREDLMNAIALNSSIFNGARVVGPAIAGVLVATIGEGWCFVLNAASYAAVIAGLLLMRRPSAVRAPQAGSAVRSMIEGFQFVARTAPVRALLLLVGLASLMGTPYTVLMPVVADRVLHGGASGYGILMAASGLGALASAPILAMRRGLHGLGRWVALSSGAFGVALVLFAVSRSFWLSTMLLLPVGFAMMMHLGASNTLIQAMVPDALRGRVMAVYAMVVLGITPFGALLAGSLAERLGAPGTVAIGGVFCIAGSAVFARHLPVLRIEARRLIAVQDQIAADGQPETGRTGAALDAGPGASI
jgi:MFS family permease